MNQSYAHGWFLESKLRSVVERFLERQSEHLRDRTLKEVTRHLNVYPLPLTDAELVDIWNACRDDDYGRIVELLMLTLQRREEIADLQWSEIDVENDNLAAEGADKE